MRKWLSLYFELSKREFNGLLALAGLIALVALAGKLFQYGQDGNTERKEELLAIQKLEAGNSLRRRYTGSEIKYHRDERTRKLFVFDPNLIGTKEWQMLGLSEKQSAAIVKYKTKGGKFRKKEDLKKMYTISGAMYSRLKAYVRIAPSNAPQTVVYKKQYSDRSRTEKPAPRIIEVNTADSALLCEISGIGPAFARRIVKYRDRIGGFYQKSQLMEVFGLDSAKYEEIKDQVSIVPEQIRKININTILFEELKNHPYLKYKQVNALISYRKQHGNYSNIADLSKVLILDPETIARIAPYLNFN